MWTNQSVCFKFKGQIPSTQKRLKSKFREYTSNAVARQLNARYRSSSLNSNDVFLLKSLKNLWMWCGRGSSGDEREMAKHLATVVANACVRDVISE